jgi:hypothetical protein
MNKVDIGRVLAVAKQRAGDFVGAVKETAQEFTWDLQDAAQAGFGVPKLISSAASLSVAVWQCNFLYIVDNLHIIISITY